MPSPMNDRDYLRQATERQQVTQSPIPIYSQDDIEAIEMAEAYQGQDRYEAAIQVQPTTPEQSDYELADTIMRGGSEVDKAYLKRDLPDVYNQWEQERSQQLDLAKTIMQSGELDTIDQFKVEFPTLYEDYQKENENVAIKAVKAAKDFAYNLVVGKHEDYEELKTPAYIDLEYADSDQAAQILRDAAEQTQYRSALGMPHVPEGMKTAYAAGTDVFGNPLVAFREDIPSKSGDDTVMIPAGTPVYTNKPGVSAMDYKEFVRAAPEMIVALATGGQSLLAQLLWNASATATMSAGRQIATEVQAPRDEGAVEKIGRIAATTGMETALGATIDIGVVGAQQLALGAAHATKRAFKNLIPDPEIQRFVSVEAVETAIAQGVPPEEAIKTAITPDGMAFIQQRGITENDLMPEVLYNMLEVSKNPVTFGLDGNYNVALARTFNQSNTLSDLVDKADPGRRDIIEAENTLFSNKSQASRDARDQFANDLVKLQESVEAYSGIPTTPSARGMEDVIPGMEATYRDAKKTAGNIFKRTLDEYLPQGYGQDVLDSTGLLAHVKELRRKFADKPGYKEDFDALERELYRYGAIDSPSKVDKDVADKIEELIVRDRAARETIEATSDTAFAREEANRIVQEARDDVKALETSIKAQEKMDRTVRRKEFTDQEKIERAKFRKASEDTLATLRRELDEAMERFKEFQKDELDIAKIERDAARGRKLADTTISEAKRQKLEAMKQKRLDTFDKVSEIRHRQAEKLIRMRAAADKEFDQFTTEAAIRLYKQLNGLKFKDLPPEVVHGLKGPVDNAMSALSTATTDPMIRGFRKGNAAWAKFNSRWSENSISFKLAQALKESRGSVSDIASSGIVKDLKKLDVTQIESLMRNLRRATRGSADAQNMSYLVRKSLQQGVMADLFNDLFSKGTELSAITKDSFDAALTKWGSNPADGMRKLNTIFQKDQGQVLESMYQLVQSRTRRPINSLSKDTDVGVMYNLYKQLSNSVWLAIKSPFTAVGVGSMRFFKQYRDELAGKSLMKTLVDPHAVAEANLNAYIKDPLKYKALRGLGARRFAQRRAKQVASGMGLEGIPYKKMTDEQKTAFHEAYQQAYPYLAEFNKREVARAAARKGISLGIREPGTGENNASQ